MKAAGRAGALLCVVGIIAIVVWLFAADPAEAPLIGINKTSTMTLSLTSSAFAHEAPIPARFTCDGENVSPALMIAGVPEGTQSLALLADDPDVPRELKPDGVFDHWTLFNIDPSTTEIGEGGSVGTPGANGRGDQSYTGPCPPPQYEPREHRYFFRLLALDITLDLPAGASKDEVRAAAEGHALEEAVLMGRYQRIAR